MTLWRISRYTDLSGAGGRLASGRWHTRGRVVVYVCDHPAACLLEMLVQGAQQTLAPSYKWLGIDVDAVSPEAVGELPQDWRDDIALTRRLGDAWLARRRTALLEVPSVIVPRASNYLLNPAHPDAARCRVRETVDYPLDPRLLPPIHVPRWG